VLDSEYLQKLGDWLVQVERHIGVPRAANEDESLQELREALGAAQAAVARMLAERRMLV
jgi:hypothetical protein